MFDVFFGRKTAGRNGVFLALFFAFANQLFSQNYPVQAGITLLPPYSDLYTSLYTNNDKLRITLLHKDLVTPNVEVFLRLRIEGPGFVLESDPLFKSSKPIALSAGVPVILNGAEISDVMDPANLHFQGISRQNFISGGSRLPQGMYQFSIRAFDYFQGNAVSNWGVFLSEISAQLPPIINVPEDGGVVQAQMPQFLNIQFFPRHSISPALNSQVHYRIRMVEILPAGRNANEVMQSTQLPFFETITSSTMFVYGSGDPPLVAGRSYALQVQAIDVSGQAVFENDGFSQVHRFFYGSKCPKPLALATKNDAGETFISWEKDTLHRSFLLEYRKGRKGEWKGEIVFQNQVVLAALQPGVAYEIQVTGICREDQSEVSDRIQFTTDTAGGAYEKFALQQCGKKLPDIDLKNQKLLPYLQAGDKIDAADFKITVLSASGGNGVFSGTGTVLLPFTGKIPVPCSFEDITINSDLRLVSGKIQILRKPLEISNQSALDISKKWRTFYGENWNKFDSRDYAGSIISIKVGSDGQLEIVGSGGKEYFSLGNNYEIKDKDGNIYYVSSGGKVSKAEGRKGEPIVANLRNGEGTPNSIKAGASRVCLWASKANGYDAWDIRTETAGRDYDKLDCKDSVYYAGWKLLRAGLPDTVFAEIFQGKKEKIHPDSIHFSRSDGTELSCFREDNYYKIAITGRMHLYADAIWAWHWEKESFGTPKRVVAGKLNLVNVDSRKMHISLVPVNSVSSGLPAAELETDLQRILSSQGLDFEVSYRRKLGVAGYDASKEIIEVDRSALGLFYKEDLSRFIRALELREPWLRNYTGTDTAFLFLLQSATEKGYMGLNRNYGFLFLNGSASIDAHTVAHEVCHGLGILEHSFGEDVSDAGASMNLMDYNPPFSLLNHHQWLTIFDREKAALRKMNLSQKAAAGKIMDGRFWTLQEMNITDKSEYLNFVVPDGKIITLRRDSILGASFSREFVRSGTVLLTKNAGNANGVLTKINYGGVKYMAHIRKNKFYGYFPDADLSKSRMDMSFYYPISEGSNAVVYGGFEDSNCSLLIQSGNYADLDRSDTLISRVYLAGLQEHISIDLGKVCLEYFDDSALSAAAKLWWNQAMYNKNFASNISTCKRIVRLIDDLGVDYKYFDFNAYRESIARYNIQFIPDFASPQVPFESKALQSFENYLRAMFYTIANQKLVLEGVANAEDLAQILLTSPTLFMQRLTLSNRVRALRILAEGGFTGKLGLYRLVYENEREFIGLSLLRTTPENQVDDLLDSLSAAIPCRGSPSLMAALCSDILGFDGAHYTAFNEILLSWIKKFRPPSDKFNPQYALENGRYFTFYANYFFGDKIDYGFDNAGRVQFNSRRQFSFYTQNLQLQPCEWLYIKFLQDFKFGETEFKKNSIAKFPAIFAYAIFNEERNKNLIKTGKLAVDVGLLALGVGEVRAAMAAGSGAWNSWKKARALVELGLSIPDLILSNGLGEQLNKTVPGQSFMEHWNTFQMYFGITSLAESGLSYVVHKIYKDADEVLALKHLDAAGEKELDAMVSELELETGILRNKSLLQFAGKVTKGGKNLLVLDAPVGQFRQLIGKDNKYHRAADFWKEESAGIEHYLTRDGKHYIKHDPGNGRTLFIDAENGAFVGFHLDDDKLFKGDYESLATTFRSVHGLPGGLRKITIGNTVIDLSSDKFNVILGRFDPSKLPGGELEIGTKQVIEQITLLKNYSFASKNYQLAPGAIHVLNIPDGLAALSGSKGMDFWKAYNKAFLEMAIENQKGANFILITTPKGKLLEEYEYGLPTGKPSYFAKELKLLEESGVQEVNFRTGETISLNDLNLEIFFKK